MKKLWNCCCCCEELNNIKLIQKVDLHNKYMCLTCLNNSNTVPIK